MAAATAMALYYPWMHFQDDSWVKLSLLTWEKLIRIRPRDLEDRDDDLIRRIRGESDLLVEIVPSANDLETVSDAFTNVLQNYRTQILERWGRNSTQDDDIYSSHNHWVWTEDLRFIAPRSQAYLKDTELTWVYCGPGGTRMDRSLQVRLNKLYLGRLRYTRDGAWIGMRPKLASIYLATLADAVAVHNDLVPTTDDPRMHSAIGAIDRLADLLLDKATKESHEEATGAYVHLALQSVLEPKNLAGVPIDRLISFRAHHKDELCAFWAHVSGLADELARASTADNPDIAHLHMQEIYDRQTKPLLRELQSSLRSYGVESVAGAMALKVDLAATSGTALGALALAGGQPILAAASVALAFVPYTIRRWRGHKERESSPVAYLLAANRQLVGRRLLLAANRKPVRRRLLRFLR